MREGDAKPNTRYNIQWWICPIRQTGMNIHWMQAMLSLKPDPVLSVGLDGLGGQIQNIYWGKGIVSLTPGIIFSDGFVQLGGQERIFTWSRQCSDYYLIQYSMQGVDGLGRWIHYTYWQKAVISPIPGLILNDFWGTGTNIHLKQAVLSLITDPIFNVGLGRIRWKDT